VKATLAAVRRRFLASLPYQPDTFQVAALDALDRGDSVVVAAPTGSGKTLVAEYAIELALAQGGKAFYTTPLKALSNQKYTDLARRYGPARTGLLTGDNSLNGDAPVVVMTTEVLRNMVYAGSAALAGLRYAVLDEVHYLQDPYRGSVWEEVIVHLPLEVGLVCLSATVSNAEELASWVGTVRGSTAAVIEDRRPVPLEDLLVAGEPTRGQLKLTQVFADGQLNPEAVALGEGARAAEGRRGKHRGAVAPRRAAVVQLLAAEKMVPAIYFIFSRAGCDEAVRQCLREVPPLTTGPERLQIRSIAQASAACLSAADRRALAYRRWLAGLEAGFGAHHAGLVPPFKEAVERCFAAGLVKVVFATGTLALGINMPARSVVVERLAKWNGERTEDLTPGEYTQLTGRAGRRGIDEVGYAVVTWAPGQDASRVAALARSRAYTLTSSFRPTYNMAANLVQRHSPEVAHHLLNLSFAQYRADADVVRLEAQLERVRQEAAEARRAAACGRGDIWQYRQQARAEGRRAGRPRGQAADVVAALERLRPGDVLCAPGPGRAGGEMAVVSTKQRKRGDLVLRAVTARRRLVSLVPADFHHPPQVLWSLELPAGFAPKSRESQRRLAAQLAGGHRAGTGRGPGTPVPPGGGVGGGVGACPELRAHLRAAARAERAGRQAERLQRQLHTRREPVARQFDRLVDLLERRHYLDQGEGSWALTDAGRRLARLYHDQDLLVAECAGRGLLDGLRPEEMAALVSVFTYEPRGPGPLTTTMAVPGGRLRARWRAVRELAAELARDEESLGLPTTRDVSPGFAPLAYGWARGGELGQLLSSTAPAGEEPMAAGDFVRNVKQLVDLLRQLADVLADPASAATAGAAAQALFRGVVAASSSVGAVE